VAVLCRWTKSKTGIDGDLAGMDGDGCRHHHGVLATVLGEPKPMRTQACEGPGLSQNARGLPRASRSERGQDASTWGDEPWRCDPRPSLSSPSIPVLLSTRLAGPSTGAVLADARGRAAGPVLPFTA